MHISKEKVSGIKFKSGMTNYSNQKNHPVKNFIQSLRWKKLKKEFSTLKNSEMPKEIENYQTSAGINAIEEVTHHWQVREVVNKIVNNSVFNNFKMPYTNERTKNELTSYELADPTTEQFMKIFKKDIQEINNGNMSVTAFKQKTGPSYDSLSHLFDIWTSSTPKTESINENIDYPLSTFLRKDTYSQMGDLLINKMEFKALNKRKDSILRKTLDLSARKIYEIGTLLERDIAIPKLKTSKTPVTKNSEAIDNER